MRAPRVVWALSPRSLSLFDSLLFSRFSLSLSRFSSFPLYSLYCVVLSSLFSLSLSLCSSLHLSLSLSSFNWVCMSVWELCVCFADRSLWFTCTCTVLQTSICLPLWRSARCRSSTSWWHLSFCSPASCTPPSKLSSGDTNHYHASEQLGLGDLAKH